MRRGCVTLEFALALVLVGCCKSSAPPAKAPNQTVAQTAAITTADGCKACNGDFGPHGIDSTPTCNCRTRDAGKRCRGKDDCEAECIGDLGDHEVTSPGPPRMGHRLGRCADFRTSYGCHVFLPPHGASPAPVPLDQAPEQLCVD